MYGPTRFEEQPKYVRRRGRKGMARYTKAGRTAKKRRWKAAMRSARGEYGPTRFEDQPGYVRRRGRKGKALSRGRKASRRARTSSRRGSSRRSSNRRDYRKFLSKRSGTYGPVRFGDQPRWVRKRGRKGKALARSRKASRGTSKRSRRSGGTTRKARRAANRAAFRSQRSRKSSRKSSRRSSKLSSGRGGRMSRSSSVAGRKLTYNELMRKLRGTQLKAWVCVGRKRTGCGGGKKGRRGSRQMGVLR